MVDKVPCWDAADNVVADIVARGGNLPHPSQVADLRSAIDEVGDSALRLIQQKAYDLAHRRRLTPIADLMRDVLADADLTLPPSAG